MARKARRKKQAVLTQSQLAGTRQREAVSAEKIAIEVQRPEKRAKATVNFREEYQYVIADLRRIGVLAAVMFAVLVAISLFLR